MKTRSLFSNLLLASALVAVVAGCTPDELPVEIDVPSSDVAFDAFDEASQTVKVKANYEWTYEVEDEHGIIKAVERTDDGLEISTNINYASVAYTAKIIVSAGSGDMAADKVITVAKGANTPTYMNILDSELDGDFPVIVMESNDDGTPSVREILVSTNNVLSVELSSDQTMPESRAAIAGNDWLTYEVSERDTDEGKINVLTLTGAFYDNKEENRNVVINIVSGNENIDNDVVTKKIAVTQLPDTPRIILPADNTVVLKYNEKTAEFSVASNVNLAVDVDPRFVSNGLKVEEVKTTGRITDYRVTVDEENWLNQEERHTVTIYDVEQGIADGLSVALYIVHEAAPAASLEMGIESLIVDNKTPSKAIEAKASIPGKVTVTAVGEDGQPVDWVTGAYDAEAEVITFAFTQAAAADRTAEVTVTVGVGDNKVEKTIPVTQLGTTPSIVLDPQEVSVPASGDAVVVKVATNQSSWAISNPTVNPDFTVTADASANTITITAKPLNSIGSREAEYTITAGEASATLKVMQKVAYKVGDPYVVNGKTVGIVYQVDEQGLHGKAFSLTVYNKWDKYFWDCDVADYPGNGYPVSRTDGWENMQVIMAQTDWENAAPAFKWTYDLGQEQGVDWYIPAVDELTELISYMSGGVAFVPSEMPGLESTLDGSKKDAVLAGWQSIRDIYKNYTGTGNSYGFTEEQYVVFGDSDLREESIWPDEGWVPVSYGDDAAALWFSSTLYTDSSMMGYYQRMGVELTGDETSWLGMASVINNLYFDCWASDGEPGDSGSIHPICRF